MKVISHSFVCCFEFQTNSNIPLYVRKSILKLSSDVLILNVINRTEEITVSNGDKKKESLKIR